MGFSGLLPPPSHGQRIACIYAFCKCFRIKTTKSRFKAPFYPPSARSRIRLSMRLSSRETCTCDMPMSLAISLCVFERKYRLMMIVLSSGASSPSRPFNKIRLSTYETEGYFNSGVLLMNLPQIRRLVHPEDVFRYAQENRQLLILPDQDILNALYGGSILPVEETIWNYDARRYCEYLITSQGEADLAWVMAHTAILHFCGKNKPWKAGSRGRFAALYRHYMRLTNLYLRDSTFRR